MVFEQIEKLKRDYTDKYVVVDVERPELRRFQSMTGIVRTVNMNGRALVEFDGLQNIGWYDIEVDFLKIVDKPQEVEKPAEPAAKPKAAAPAASQPAEKKAPESKKGAGGMSVDDVLAAARGGGSGAASKSESRPGKEEASGETKAATAKSAAEMSVEDVLAAARGGGAPAAKAKSKEVEAQQPSDAAEADEAPAQEAAQAEASPETETDQSEKATAERSETSADAGDLPTDVEGIVAFCRQRDG